MRAPLILFSIFLSGCVALPEGVTPVKGFDIDRYTGKWYEIARLDHSFERGLSGVHAEYSLNHDGGIKVINRGYDAKDGKWREAEGRAYFVRDKDEGYLKVSFFGPFYGAYVIFDLDREHYQHSFVAGNSRDYLWLLARTPTVTPSVMKRFIDRARALGFDTGQLIRVGQKIAEPAAAPGRQDKGPK